MAAGSECLAQQGGDFQQEGIVTQQEVLGMEGGRQVGRQVEVWVGLCQHDLEGFLVGGVKSDENWYGL